MEIRKIRPGDARAAALLHMEGQQGTFLASLGEEFLTAFYARLCDSQWGYAFVAVEGDTPLGVIVGAGDTRALFKEFITKRGVHLAIPVLRRLLSRPSLLGGVLQSFFYPSKVGAAPGEAEFLFIGVSAQARRQGIGSKMLHVLIEESRRRGAKALQSTVDVNNRESNGFHVKFGFQIVGSMELHGKKMNLYSLPLQEAKAGHDEVHGRA